MAHKLRPVLRVDAEIRSAFVELRGCLTVPATDALLKVLARSRSLNRNLELHLDLRRTLHIDPGSLANLHLPLQPADGFPLHKVTGYLELIGPFQVLFPPEWPICPVERALAGPGYRKSGNGAN